MSRRGIPAHVHAAVMPVMLHADSPRRPTAGHHRISAACWTRFPMQKARMTPARISAVKRSFVLFSTVIIPSSAPRAFENPVKLTSSISNFGFPDPHLSWISLSMFTASCRTLWRSRLLPPCMVPLVCTILMQIELPFSCLSLSTKGSHLAPIEHFCNQLGAPASMAAVFAGAHCRASFDMLLGRVSSIFTLFVGRTAPFGYMSFAYCRRASKLSLPATAHTA